MSGEIDHLLKIVVPDIHGYDAVYKRLIKVAELSDVSSSFAGVDFFAVIFMPMILYFRQKCELNKTSTDSSSSRPSNIAKLKIPSWKGFRPP